MKLGVRGFRCGECDTLFSEDCAGSSREAAISEAHGAREVRSETYLECPDCGSWDLEPAELCYRCEEHETYDAGLCAVCSPPDEEPDFAQADLDTLAEGNFKRDRSAA